MTHRLVHVLVLLVIGSANRLLAADWPMYRCDAARSGFTAEPLPNQLKLRWVCRSKHPPRPAWPTSERMQFDLAFQPIVIGDTVVFGSSADDKVYALDAKSGQQRWTFFTEGPVRFAPVGWQDRVFVVSDDGWLYAISLCNGSLLWKHRGGPDDRKILGNERLISHWPARGGPVVLGDTVYFAAGIWPSDGVYLHALHAQTGRTLWTNDKTGTLEMDQPHPGARAKSGVSAQGYLLTTDDRLFVPTGRSVPAAFRRSDGKLEYYHLQKNHYRGGSRAMLAEQFLYNAGCLFDVGTGDLASQMGLGATVATPGGIVRAEGRSLVACRWKDAERWDRKGNLVRYRALKQGQVIRCEREVLELIIADTDAVRGENGRVSTIDYTRQCNTWWSHDVEGQALGLAYANGRLIVSTDQGLIYCFDGEPDEPRRSPDPLGSPTSTSCRKVDYAKAAEEIIRRTAVTEGFCVDLGCGTGDLALELAERTKLKIYAIESDEKLVAIARRKLDEVGLYGTRVTVHHADPAKPPYPKRFANLIVSSRSLNEPISSQLDVPMRRMQRPYGGKICVWRSGELTVCVRDELPGTGSWTHQNADPANTLCSMDRLIKGPIEMFWFRDVDFQLPNRHGQGPSPLYHRGHMVVGGVHGLCALDAYNGRTLWTFELEDNLKDYDGIHHDVGVGETGSNFCVSNDSVYVRNGTRCLRVELATGRKLAEFTTPVPGDAGNRAWGYLAYTNGLLYGTVVNEDHTVSPRYKLSKLYTESVLLFALDATTGKLRWRYRSKHSIRNNAIAIGGGHVFLIDRPLAMADRITHPRRGGKHRPPLEPGEHPGGMLISLDAVTGDVRWTRSEDIFGTQLAVSEKHGIVLMNYQAVRHKFFKLPSEIGGRIAAFEASAGRRLWDQEADYKTRPLINDTVVYAQGGAWDLKTGKAVPFDLSRSYGCGQISASVHLMLFRSATLGYLDLSRRAGIENYGGIRPGCWINAIPAGGLVLVPDGSTRCRCSYQMRAWLALQKSE